MLFARSACLVLAAVHALMWHPLAVSAGEIIDEEDGLTLTEEQAYYAASTYAKALARLTKNAVTDECKEKIEREYKRYLEPLSLEQSYPFERTTFWPQCPTVKKPGLKGVHWKSEGPPKQPPTQPYPPRSDSTLIPENLSILYVLLVHDHPEFVKRLLNSLDEPMHHFVIHVDKKSDSTYQSLVEFAGDRQNVHVLVDRVNGVWGGFSLVNATLLGLKYAFDHDLSFDFAIDMSGQSYPIKSNEVIRKTLAGDSNKIYMDIRADPNVPAPELWHHYVECDNRGHRITRMATPRGMHLFMGSQWFILPRHAVQWLLTDSLPREFIEYAKHIMVADEHYFTTLIKNSPYCADQVGKNLNYLVFGEWEQELLSRNGEKDVRKCNQPDPQHCGRSPTTLTKQFLRSVKASRSLFARKFDPANSTSMEFVDLVDEIRKEAPIDFTESEDDNHVYMIQQRLTESSDATPPALCLQLPVGQGTALEAVACNPNDESQWFNLGQCIGTDGSRRQNVKKNLALCGNREANAPDEFCFFKTAARQVLNATKGVKPGSSIPFCLDISGENPRPGGGLIGYDCTGGWNQHFRMLPDCTISAVQPKAVGVARGMKQPEELTVCAQIQSESNKKRVLKTAACPVDGAADSSQVFDFLLEYEGVSWRKLQGKEAPIHEPPVSKQKRHSSLSNWAKEVGRGGGIKKHDEI